MSKKAKEYIMKTNISAKPLELENEAPVLRVRHNRFDGFDVYTVEMHGRKTLYHKEVLDKPLIIGGVFKLLGINNDMWLCENIDTKMIHIASGQSFQEYGDTTLMSPAWPTLPFWHWIRALCPPATSSISPYLMAIFPK